MPDRMRSSPIGAVPGPFVEPPDLPERFRVPSGWRWERLEGAGGVDLRTGSAAPPGAVRGEVLILPGYSEFAEKYSELARWLLERGFAVAALDWRGQGGSQRAFAHEPQRVRLDAVETLVGDLEHFIAARRAAGPGRPLALVAHSLGGHVAARYLARRPEGVSAAVLCAPALALRIPAGIPPWLFRAVPPLAAALGLGSRYAPGEGPWRDDPGWTIAKSPVSHDPERGALHGRWFHANPALRVGGATLGWVAALNRSAAAIAAPDFAAGWRTPTLVGIAGDERFVDNAAIERFCAEAAGTTCLTFPAAKHELFMEVDSVRGPWLDAVTDFLASALPDRRGQRNAGLA